MPEESPHTASVMGRSSRRRLLWITAVVLAVLAPVLWVLAGPGDGSSEPPAATTTVASTPPPFPWAPFAVSDVVALTVPEETRFARGTFWAEADAEYVVTMDLRSTKPEGSGGRSMYLGVTLSCAPQTGGPGISAGGTQNMLTGEEATYRNQGLISVPEDGRVDCSIKLSAPYDDVASAGTTFPVEATWRVARAGGATEAPTNQVLPTVIAPGEDEEILTVDLALESPGVDLEALSSLHLTTCTIVNGSREDDKAWCDEDDLDEAGSTATLRGRMDLIDADGAICGEIADEGLPADHIDLYRHHRLLSLALEATAPEQPCGQTVRVTISVQNDGPAPLVVHRSNSTLLLTSGVN